MGVRKEEGRGEKGREGKQKESEGGGRMMIHNRAVSLKLLPTCTEIHTISNQHSLFSKASKLTQQLTIHGPMIFTVIMIFTVMTY